MTPKLRPRPTQAPLVDLEDKQARLAPREVVLRKTRERERKKTRKKEKSSLIPRLELERERRKTTRMKNSKSWRSEREKKDGERVKG